MIAIICFAFLVCFASAAGKLAPLTSPNDSISESASPNTDLLGLMPEADPFAPPVNLKDAAPPNSVWFWIKYGEKEMVRVYGSNANGNEYFKCPSVPSNFLANNCDKDVEASQENIGYGYGVLHGSAYCRLDYNIARHTPQYYADREEERKAEEQAREEEEKRRMEDMERDMIIMDPIMDPMDPIMHLQIPEVTAPSEPDFDCRGFIQALMTEDTDLGNNFGRCAVTKPNVRLTQEVSESNQNEDVSESTSPSTDFLGLMQDANDRYKNIASVNDSLASSVPPNTVWFEITAGDEEMFHAYGSNADGSAYFKCPPVTSVTDYFKENCKPEHKYQESIIYGYGVLRGTAYCRLDYHIARVPGSECEYYDKTLMTTDDDIELDNGRCAVGEPHVRVFLGDPWL